MNKRKIKSLVSNVTLKQLPLILLFIIDLNIHHIEFFKDIIRSVIESKESSRTLKGRIQLIIASFSYMQTQKSTIKKLIDVKNLLVLLVHNIPFFMKRIKKLNKKGYTKEEIIVTLQDTITSQINSLIIKEIF